MTARSPSPAVDRLGVVLRQPGNDDLDAVLSLHATWDGTHSDGR